MSWAISVGLSSQQASPHTGGIVPTEGEVFRGTNHAIL